MTPAHTQAARRDPELFDVPEGEGVHHAPLPWSSRPPGPLTQRSSERTRVRGPTTHACEATGRHMLAGSSVQL